jgi:hypothetical protein
MSPLIFLLPILPAHGTLHSARVLGRQALLHEADLIYLENREAIRSGTVDSQTISRFHQLHDAYRYYGNLPLVPLTGSILAKFIGVVVVSLLPLILLVCR